MSCLSQCGSTYTSLSRSVPETHEHVAGTLSNNHQSVNLKRKERHGSCVNRCGKVFLEGTEKSPESNPHHCGVPGSMDERTDRQQKTERAPSTDDTTPEQNTCREAMLATLRTVNSLP